MKEWFILQEAGHFLTFITEQCEEDLNHFLSLFLCIVNSDLPAQVRKGDLNS